MCVRFVFSKQLGLLGPVLAGLDFKTRPTLLSLLHSVHVSNNPSIIMGLRLQDPIPDWVSHIALVQGGRVTTGEKAGMVEKLNLHSHETAHSAAAVCNRGSSAGARTLVDMRNVNVRYHERHVRWRFFPLLCVQYLPVWHRF